MKKKKKEDREMIVFPILFAFWLGVFWQLLIGTKGYILIPSAIIIVIIFYVLLKWGIKIVE